MGPIIEHPGLDHRSPLQSYACDDGESATPTAHRHIRPIGRLHSTGRIQRTITMHTPCCLPPRVQTQVPPAVAPLAMATRVYMHVRCAMRSFWPSGRLRCYKRDVHSMPPAEYLPCQRQYRRWRRLRRKGLNGHEQLFERGLIRRAKRDDVGNLAVVETIVR